MCGWRGSSCAASRPRPRADTSTSTLAPGRERAQADAIADDDQDHENHEDSEEVHSEGLARVVDEGRTRLTRSWPSLTATGLVGGFDVGMGVLAAFVVHHATGNNMLAALAFSIGFILLVLAGSELFTENFFVPVVSVVATDDLGPPSVLRLWGGTLVANVVAGWVLMWLVVSALPDLDATIVELARHWPELGIGSEAFASAVLAGMVMTLLTWLEHRAPDTAAKLAVAVSMGFLLAAAPLNHAVVRTIEMSAALVAGAPFGYLDALGVLGWASLGNALGGLGLVTLVRLVQIGGPALRREQARPDRRPRDQG